MPPAAADQFFTSRASSLMHTNSNTNNDNGPTNANKSTTATTLKTLINYNNNNNSVYNNNNCPQDKRNYSSSKSSSSSSCGSCLRYQRGQKSQSSQPLSGELEESRNREPGSFGAECRRMTTISSNEDHPQVSHGGQSHHHSKSKSTTTHRRPCTNNATGLSHSYYDCCINVHVSALLDHWLDWPSNHCPPPTNPSERNGFSDPNHLQQKELHAKEESSTFNGTMQEEGLNRCDNQYLYSLVSSQTLSRISTSNSLASLTAKTPFCVYSANSESCQGCESCELYQTLSRSSSPEDGEEVVNPDSFILEQLASHVGKHVKDIKHTETLSRIRKFFAAKGCDIINYQDCEGKTLLHYSITGEAMNLEAFVRQLIEAGADPNIPDMNGETVLLLTRHLFDRGMYSLAYATIRTLICDYPGVAGNVHHRKINVNATNVESRGSLLCYAVQHGDKTSDVTRLLLNSGASVWQENDSTKSGSNTKKRAHKRSPNGLNCHQTLQRRSNNSNDDSVFTWYLRSLMAGSTDIKTSKQTLYMLCTAMESQQNNKTTMRQHIDRTMLELGVAPKINGPLFKKLRAEINPFIAKPQSLRFICIKSIRKSIGKRQREQMIRVTSSSPPPPPSKRLRTNSSSTSTPSIRPLHTSSYLLRNRRHSNPAVSSSTTAVKSNVSGTTISNCKLKLPHKLQQFVCLEEMVVPN